MTHVSTQKGTLPPWRQAQIEAQQKEEERRRKTAEPFEAEALQERIALLEKYGKK